MAGQSFSSLLAPVLIRLALGATLLWSGIGLLSAKMSVTGERAAILANIGAVAPKSGGGSQTVEPLKKDEPVKPEAPAKKDEPAPAKPEAPKPAPDPKPQTPKPASDTGFETPPLMQVAPTTPPPQYSGADFAEPVEVPRLYRLSLLMHDAANPVPRADGNVPPALWMKSATAGRWPFYVAWFNALAQVVGGAIILVGLFTRLGGFLCSVSLGLTLWLLLIVPAVHSGTAQWGFIPAGGAWDINAAGESVHGLFLWTLLQFCCALSLMLTGAGFLSLDRILFPGGEPESRPRPKQIPARPTPGD